MRAFTLFMMALCVLVLAIAAIPAPAPRRYYRLHPDGTTTGSVTEVSLRNGQGAIFLYHPMKRPEPKTVAPIE